MIVGMSRPRDLQLHSDLLKATRHLPTEELHFKDPTVMDSRTFVEWDVKQRDFGYQWSKHSVHSFNQGTSSGEAYINHQLRRHNALYKLFHTNMGPIMRAAGIIIERDISEIYDVKATQYHVRYPTTQDFVRDINPALAEAGRGLRFEVWRGGQYPATHMITRLGAEHCTFPVGTDPHYNNHDMLYHGLGWLALPDNVIERIHERAQTTRMLGRGSFDAQVELASNLEKHINIISATELHEKRMYAENITQITSIPIEVIQRSAQQHLYGKAT